MERGYQAIYKGKTPPDLDPEDKSPYAQGVRNGAASALDEREARYQQWLDPLSMLLGTHPSRKLNKELTKRDGPRPSKDYDGHHIVPWRHWRSQPARDVLEKFGIDINTAENGVWLRREFHQPLANSKRYMNRVNELLGRARNRQEALDTLKAMKNRLSREKLP
jgi:hypothetical protein